MDRRCPAGNHFVAVDQFRYHGVKIARDCMHCEDARAKRIAQKASERHDRETFRGLDMDRIYRVRPDLVRKK